MARAVKDEDELATIREAIAIADAGQAAARSAFAAGRTELELWAEVRDTMEREAAGRLPVHADVLTGPRTAQITGSATTRSIEEDDLLIVDLSPRLRGYWADSCATLALGSVPADVGDAFQRACAALEQGIASVRPGVSAGEIDAAVQATAGGFPHHTGHGLGVTFHEEPRVVPGSQRVLAPGMVIALEPASYGDGWGVRVERVVLVTEDGCEVLSRHDLAL
jgi:Xaa-Pro aminopeptidase